MQGVHSIDVGILINPILVEFMKGMADIAEVEYNLGDKDKDEEPDPQLLQLAMKELKESEDVIEQASTDTQEEMIEEEPQGLMARRSM